MPRKSFANFANFFMVLLAAYDDNDDATAIAAISVTVFTIFADDVTKRKQPTQRFLLFDFHNIQFVNLIFCGDPMPFECRIFNTCM